MAQESNPYTQLEDHITELEYRGDTNTFADIRSAWDYAEAFCQLSAGTIAEAAARHLRDKLIMLFGGKIWESELDTIKEIPEELVTERLVEDQIKWEFREPIRELRREEFSKFGWSITVKRLCGIGDGVKEYCRRACEALEFSRKSESAAYQIAPLVVKTLNSQVVDELMRYLKEIGARVSEFIAKLDVEKALFFLGTCRNEVARAFDEMISHDELEWDFSNPMQTRYLVTIKQSYVLESIELLFGEIGIELIKLRTMITEEYRPTPKPYAWGRDTSEEDEINRRIAKQGIVAQIDKIDQLIKDQFNVETRYAVAIGTPQIFIDYILPKLRKRYTEEIAA